MATLFVSHASRDDRLCSDLEDWLISQGFDDLFIDHESIRGGDRWGDALRAAKASCRAVICLVTENWLDSDDCTGEFMAAWYLGKRIIPLLALSGGPLSEPQVRRLRRLTAEDQGFNIVSAIADGRLALDRLPDVASLLAAGLRASGALVKVGLDPEAFEVDKIARPSPYPGLESFDDTDADAAIFFGRTPEILRSLEDLREMRANGSLQPYIIIGASGSGKSSLLRAGVLPRLRRERGWIVLRAFRPGADPLLNFCSAIIQTLEESGLKESPGPLRDEVLAAWRAGQEVSAKLPAMVNAELCAPIERKFDVLRQRLDREHATILVPVDQAEELVHASGESGDVLAECMRILSLPPPADPSGVEQSTPRVLFCLTIRTDSLPALQTSARFAGIAARSSGLRPVPLHRFSAAIEGPAKRYGVAIEAGLVETMIEDTPNEDALPLLAFALQRLWKQYSADNTLRRASYEALGKMSGMISDAAERALGGLQPEDDAPGPPGVSAETLKLASRAFVPPLAQVTETGAAVRRVSGLEKFDQKALALLERFVDWRLLVKKASADGASATIEVAHEAIFRSWPRLRNWIEAEKVRLQVLHDVDDAAASWDKQERRGAYLDHRGDRLKGARDLLKIDDFAVQLGSVARDYLNACEWAQTKRRLAAAFVAAMVAIAAFVGFATYDTLAMQQAMRDRANVLVRGGYPTAAAKYAIAGAIGDFDATRVVSSDPGNTNIEETGFILKLLIDLPIPYSVDKYFLTDDGRRLFVKSRDEGGSIWDVEKQEKLTDFGDGRSVVAFEMVQKLSRLITRSADNALAIWDTETGARIGGSEAKMYKSAKIISETARMTTLSEDNTCKLWDLVAGKEIATVGSEHEVDWCQISDTGTHVLTRNVRYVAAIWSAADGKWIADVGKNSLCYTCQFGSVANRVFLVDPDGKASLFNMTSGQFVADLPDAERIAGAGFSPDGKRIVLRSVRSTLTLWNAATGEKIAGVGSSDPDNYAFVSDGRRVMSRASNGSGELRDADQGTLLKSFPPGSIQEYKVSKAGNRLVTIAFDKSASLWKTETGEKIADVARKGEAESVVLSKDGTRLSVGSDAAKGALWDATTGKKLTDFQDEGADAGGAFSGDSTRYLSLSPNNYGTLWDAVEGRMITSLGGEGATQDADIADDNYHIVTNSVASTGSVWDVRSRATAALGRSSVRAQVCEMNYAPIGAFSEEEREGDDEQPSKLAHHLRGRPWHPCDWRGLLSLEGWAQELRHWAVIMGFRWDYQCGERRAFGGLRDAAASCEELDTESMPANKLKSQHH